MGAEDKTALRRRFLAGRRCVADQTRVAESRALVAHLESVVSTGSTVCAYVPVGTEPGSIELLDAALCRAARVLLPVALTADDDTPLPLQWAQYRPGQLVARRFGLLQPPEPWLPASTVVDADVVLVPALAVDRHGVRLGRGRGYYDRSLTLRRPKAQLVAVVRDEEVVDGLPCEPHDVLMTHALTPGRGLIALGVVGERRGRDGGSST
jgi:5-formyltetrahydrofolate cyclo-ligase